MQDYVRRLCDLLLASLGEEKPIYVVVDCDAVRLSTDKAVKTGLIINECVTNALKYAFPGEMGGTIRVTLSEPPLTLTIDDDGVGCSGAEKDGLGTRLMRLMADDLGATIIREPLDKGLRIRLIVDKLA